MMQEANSRESCDKESNAPGGRNVRSHEFNSRYSRFGELPRKFESMDEIGFRSSALWNYL